MDTDEQEVLSRASKTSDKSISMTSGARNRSRSRLYINNTKDTQNRQTAHLPNEDKRKTFLHFKYRHGSDSQHPTYRFESVINLLAEDKYKPLDNADVLSRGPSYSKFKIPYEMICSRRYNNSIKAYEAQLEHEIRQNIDFQSTAADACYFVRCMAITTFWPPLHNMTEVKHTSKNFFQLSESEKWRLQIIMDTDIT